ncbi:MAG: alpha/beta hydrolase [Acidimicrobiia bacterium]
MSIAGDWAQLGEHRKLLGNDVFVVDVAAESPGAPEPAEPVLVLHGFPTSSIDWRRVIGPMREGRRVILFDFLGYGFSAKPDQRYSLFEQADLVEALVADLGIRAAVIVSHDMGDSVAGELCARSLDGTLGFEITRRVLANGSIYLDMAHLTDGQQLLLSLPDEQLPEGLGFELVEAALAATCAPAMVPPADELAAMADAVVRDGGDRLLSRLIRYVEERRQHEGRWTGAIETHPSPLTIVWGTADPIAVWPMAQRLHAARPDATLVELDGVGHYPMVEDPERFGAALRAALKR